jgi:hypothetical protein
MQRYNKLYWNFVATDEVWNDLLKVMECFCFQAWNLIVICLLNKGYTKILEYF